MLRTRRRAVARGALRAAPAQRRARALFREQRQDQQQQCRPLQPDAHEHPLIAAVVATVVSLFMGVRSDM
ncbi:MAG TPA: hypothetical protein PLZ50_03470 [Rubrivivax sp.]|nr:hypothetical protein [Rubrivivax sp.]